MDNQKSFAKNEHLLKKIVELIDAPVAEIKFAAICTLKNLLFKCPRDVKSHVMKELQWARLLSYTTDKTIKVAEQALIAYRNLLYKTSEDI